MLELVPIKERLEENKVFEGDPDFQEMLMATTNYYKIIGFVPPWIGYYALLNGELVGSGGFKGQPISKKIEIAYGSFPNFRNKGIATEICRQLVQIAEQTDPEIIITARTLPANNHSAGVLKKNQFRLMGTVWDKDDGEVLEWVYERQGI